MNKKNVQLVKIIKGATILAKAAFAAIPIPFVGTIAAELLDVVSPMLESKLTEEDKARVEQKIDDSNETIRIDPNSAEAHYTSSLSALILWV